MANVKITALTNLAAGDVAVDDVFIIDDISVPESKKITVANLRAAVDTIATSNINTVSSNVDSLETSVNTILANVDSVQDNVASVGSNTEGFTSNQHTISATANILPGSNNIYSLGSPEAVWQEVYIGPNSLKLGALTISDTGGETITVTGASGAQGNLSTAAVAGVSNLTANVVSLESNTADLAAGIAGISVDTAAGTETRLNANLDITNDNVTSLTTTVDNFGTYANTNLDTKANVSATYLQLTANLDVVQDNVATLTTTVDNFGTYANTNLDTKANVSATYLQLNANLDVVQDNVATLTTTVDNYGTYGNTNFDTKSNVSATYLQLNANLDVVQDNVASIIDGTTPFTGEVTFQDQVTVQGNLIITGAQVDLGVTSAQVDDTTLLLAANLTAAQPLTADAGILINRGQDANVFFGFAAYGDHIDFIFTDAPADNVNHYAISYIDIHANSFGAEGLHDTAFTAVHHADRPTTGLIFPTNEINAVIGGAYKANVTASGLEAVAVYSDGVELQANDSATLFSAYSNDFITYTLINANVDVVQDNVATLTTTVDNFGTYANSNAAALASDIATLSTVDTATGTETRLNANLDITNDNVTANYTQLNANIDVVQDNVVSLTTTVDNFGTYANTNLDTKSNVSATYTQLNANIDVVQDNVASITTRSDAFGTYANSTFSTVANAAALAAGISGIASAGAFPTGDYGLLDVANSSTDSFGVAVAGLTTFDMKTDPSGTLDTEDLGALT